MVKRRGSAESARAEGSRGVRVRRALTTGAVTRSIFRAAWWMKRRGN